MKKIILILFLIFVQTAHAGTFIINYTDEQYKAVEAIVLDPQQWLQNAWDNKAFRCVDHVIERESAFNPSKMSGIDKKNWIVNNTFKTRVEVDAELEAQ